jgi:hypothetical protein
MMTAKMYQELLEARISHQQWVLRIKKLIEQGSSVGQNFLDKDETTCEFGKWLQQTYSHFHDSPSLQFLLQSIEGYHNDMHRVYLKIDSIYFKELQLPLGLTKLFGISKEPNLEQQKLISLMFLEIENLSKMLLKELDILEQTLKLSQPQKEVV